MTNRLLVNRQLWPEIRRQLSGRGRRHCAIAYFGQGAAEMLPLKTNDVLVVDMSLGCVRQGATDPREVEKLMKRGVKVYSRDQLHAKVVVTQDAAIVGSANASRNSAECLEEAALYSTSPALVVAARHYVVSLATAPVHPGYLELCKNEYRPPTFRACRRPPRPGSRSTRRIPHAKLWFLAGLAPMSPPASETEAADRIREVAEDALQHKTHQVEQIFYTNPPALLGAMKKGDRIVQCVNQGSRRHIEPPGQLLTKRSYSRGPNRHRRHVLCVEVPPNGENISFTDFSRAIRTSSPRVSGKRSRSVGITNAGEVDALLRLWKYGGKRRY